MRLQSLLFLFVVIFSAVHYCSAQDTMDQTESLSTGERLRRVEEQIEVLRTRKHHADIDVLRKLESELRKMLETDPSSVFKSQIEADLDFVNENVGDHELMVASYYMNTGHGFRAASLRLRNVTQRYPKFSKMDEVLFRLIRVSAANQEEQDAVRYSWSLICNYPNSEYVKPAFEQLNSIGVRSWEGCQKYKLQ
jgi:outer membrane protein assembly factor BamD (BamD/ComL family)